MSRKTEGFSAVLLKKVKKLIPTLRFSEVVSGCKQFYKLLQSCDSNFLDLLNSVFLFFTTLLIIMFFIVVYAIVGGYVL